MEKSNIIAVMTLVARKIEIESCFGFGVRDVDPWRTSSDVGL